MKNIYNLNTNDKIIIENKEFNVESGIEFVNNNFYWREYTLLDNEKNLYSLNVKEDIFPEKRYSLYEKTKNKKDSEKFSSNIEENYEIIESGIAKIVSFFEKGNISKGAEFIYIYYKSIKDNNSLLSHQSWESRYIEYSIGKYIEEKYITGVSFEKHERGIIKENITFEELDNVNVGRYLVIENKKYYINSIAEKEFEDFSWKENLIVNVDTELEYTLVVLNKDDKLSMEIYESIKQSSIRQRNEYISLSREGINYSFLGSGKGRVINTFFSAYEPAEEFYLQKYVSEDEKNMVVLERWTVEEKAFAGRKINNDEIELLYGKDRNKFTNEADKFRVLIFLICVVLFILFIGYVEN